MAPQNSFLILITLSLYILKKYGDNSQIIVSYCIIFLYYAEISYKLDNWGNSFMQLHLKLIESQDFSKHPISQLAWVDKLLSYSFGDSE